MLDTNQNYKHKGRSPEELRHPKGRWPGRRGRPACWWERGGDGGCAPPRAPLGNSTRRSVANSGARVPKVLPTAKLEDLFSGLIIVAGTIW